MDTTTKQILTYATLFTLVVAAVIAGNYIFYKVIVNMDVDPGGINKENTTI